MPTADTIIVDTDSGASRDYATWAAADAAEARDISVGTGTDEVVTFKLRASAGAADTSRVYISASWTTDYANGNTVTVICDETPTNTGVWDTGIYRLAPSGYNSNGTLRLRGGTKGWYFINLQVEGGASGNYCGDVLTGGGSTDFWWFEDCIIRGGNEWGSSTRNSKAGKVAAVSGTTSTSAPWYGFRNCLFYVVSADSSQEYSILSCNYREHFYLANCTWICADNQGTGGSTGVEIAFYAVIINGIGQDASGSGTDATTPASGGALTTTLTSDTTGTSGLTSISLTFVDAANGDYHLAAGDTSAMGVGTDLDSHANYPVTDDIDGDTRDATAPDVGYDEYVAAGGGPPDSQLRKRILRDEAFGTSGYPKKLELMFPSLQKKNRDPRRGLVRR